MVAPLIFVWPYALLFWTVFAWVTVPEVRLFRQAKKSGAMGSMQDEGTAQLIVQGTTILLLVAILTAFLLSPATLTYRRKLFFMAGVGLLIAGSALRRHCFRMLGRHFTYAVEVSSDQPVVDAGAYRILRHPSYLAGMLIDAGWGFALTNWVSVALLIVFPTMFYAARIAVEERALLATIGDAYREYMGRTKKLIPYLY